MRAPLVLVHGTGASAAAWGRTVADLERGGYEVIAYDRRGYGGSSQAPVRDHRVHVDDLATVIRAAGAPAHVLGWSSGGSLALALATRHPELLRSVVVMEAPWHGIRGATPELLGVLARVKLDQARRRPRAAAERFFRWASGRTDGPSGYDRLDGAAREALLAHAPVVLRELDPHPFGVMMEHVPTAHLARIEVPVTWLVGGASIPWYARLRERALRAAPAVRTATVPGGSHLAHVEVPEAFATAVLDALS